MADSKKRASAEPGAEQPDVQSEEAPPAVAESVAAPLEPPARAAQREPVLGLDHSTTNHVAANAALRSVSGSTHEGLVDEDGNALDVDDVFEFPGPGNPRTVARVKRRVFERFKYPNATTVTTQLLYHEGVEVPLWQAHQVVAKYRHVQENTATSVVSGS